jgi:magnesium chelatase family protein
MKILTQPEANSLCSAAVREQVCKARAIQEQRQSCPNSALAQNKLQDHCALAPEAQKLMDEAVDKLKLSPRSYHRLLRVSRTIADLAAEESIAQQHVAEALSYRNVLKSLIHH